MNALQGKAATTEDTESSVQRAIIVVFVPAGDVETFIAETQATHLVAAACRDRTARHHRRRPGRIPDCSTAGWLYGQPSGDPSMTFSMRFADGRQPDLVSLPFLADAAYPASEALLIRA